MQPQLVHSLSHNGVLTMVFLTFLKILTYEWPQVFPPSVDIYPSTICKSSWPHLVLGQSYCRVPNQLSYTIVHSSPIDQDKLCMVPLKCCWWNPDSMKCWQHGPTDVVLAYEDIRCWKTSPMFGSVNVWVASNETKIHLFNCLFLLL